MFWIFRPIKHPGGRLKIFLRIMIGWSAQLSPHDLFALRAYNSINRPGARGREDVCNGAYFQYHH